MATASRIGPSVFVVCIRALLRKIFEVPKPRMNRPGANSCTTRASIATCTGCRVNGEMIPQAIVSRFVCSAMSAETTAGDRDLRARHAAVLLVQRLVLACRELIPFVDQPVRRV